MHLINKGYFIEKKKKQTINTKHNKRWVTTGEEIKTAQNVLNRSLQRLRKKKK